MSINKKPYIDVHSYIDMNKFESLHPDICSGFVNSKHLADLGLLYMDKKDQDCVRLENYTEDLKPVYYLYDKFKQLPDDNPIKIKGNEFKNDNDLILYLTYALGAHNPFKIYSLFNFTTGWMNNSNIREYTETSKYFPTVVEWINDLEIFSHIGRAYFLVVEGGGISYEHCDSNPHNGIINEFIHIRSDLDRPLYVRDTNTSKKVYIDTKAVYFDDQCYHGGDATAKSTYALRIDGIFSEEFRKIIWQ